MSHAFPGAAHPGREASQPHTLLIGTLALLSAVAPLATDMYLPAFPAMARELRSPPSAIQLTLTAFLVGLALGQLVIGPLSDQYGRRRPLLAGSLTCLAGSLACALAPTVTLLAAGRFVQGFGGGAGIVIGRAVISDRARGAAAARLFSLMMMIGGIAPIVAPVMGSIVIIAVGWRGVLWVLAALSAVMVIGVLVAVPETLPPPARHAGGFATLVRNARVVLANRAYRGYTLAYALAFSGMFAYIAASPFVLQTIVGLSKGVYSVAFGVNAGGIVLLSAVSGRLAGRVSPRRMLFWGLRALVVLSVLLMVDVLGLGVSRWPTIVLFFGFVATMGLVFGNGAALATGQVPHQAGTGSAVLGALQFGLGAAVSPIVGLAGDADALPMAATMLTVSLLALLAATTLTRSAVDAAR